MLGSLGDLHGTSPERPVLAGKPLRFVKNHEDKGAKAKPMVTPSI